MEGLLKVRLFEILLVWIMWWGFKLKTRGSNFVIFLPHLLSTLIQSLHDYPHLSDLHPSSLYSPALSTPPLPIMSKKGLPGGAPLSKDAPWRASGKPIPKINHAPLLRISQSPFSNYALSVMKASSLILFPLPFLFDCFLDSRGTFLILFLQHPDPIGSGLATDAILEAAGPDCIVPGQSAPVKLLGLKVLFLLSIFSFL